MQNVTIGTVTFGGPQPVMIMGPCVIESRQHALDTARTVQDLAGKHGFPVVYKSSFDKANRTSHSSFRGHGIEAGLEILAEVKAVTGMPVTTDVHESTQVAQVAAVVDLLQVPAFLCRQSDLVDACARSGKATSIKKGQFLAPWDCKSIVSKYRAAGGTQLILIERGNSFGYNTLVTDFRSLPIMRGLGVPVVFDGTHSVQMPGGNGTTSGGQSFMAPAMCRAAMAVGCEGIFMEVHNDPSTAPSDGPNMIPFKYLDGVLAELRAIANAVPRKAPELAWPA